MNSLEKLTRNIMYSRLPLVSVLCLLLFALPFYIKANEANKLAFAQYQITAPFTVSLPVIVVDLLPEVEFPADELVLIGDDEQGNTWLAVYVFEEKNNRFVMLDKLALSDKYFAFDVSEHNQGLYLLAKNAVVSLRYHRPIAEPDSTKPVLYLQPVQQVSSIFRINQSRFITEKDFIQDVNDDGLDDIVLADFEYLNLWLSSTQSDALFYQSLPINAYAELLRESVHFTPTIFFLADINLDNRQDIAWVSQGTLNYFNQVDGGIFSNLQQTLALADSISGLYWWQIREADGESRDQSNLTHRVVEKMQDINNDGLVDIIVRFTQSSGVLDRANNYEFYTGSINKQGQLAFAKKANTSINIEGTVTGLRVIDINNDNKFEVLLSAFELSVSNIIGALLSGGISQDVQLFALNEDDFYDQKPAISKEVELSFSLTSGQSGQPIILLTDVNGDKLQDLVLSDDEDQLAIFLGQNSGKLLHRKASKHEFLLPKNGALFRHFDINHDGKEDFIMRYGRLDDKHMANKVTILLTHLVK